MTIFTAPEPRRPFKAIGEAFGGGITQGLNQAIEQDVINKILTRVNQGNEDPLSAILGSNLPGQRKNELVNAFQNQQQIQLQQANALDKAKPTSDKIGEEFLKKELDKTEDLGNLQLGLEDAKEALASGNVSGRTNVKAKLFPTEADQLLKQGVKPFLGISKQFFGSNVAKEQTKLLLDMFPSPGKSERENRVAFRNMQRMVQMKERLTDIVQNDPAVQSGNVTSADVIRIKQNQKAALKNFFDELRNQKKALAEAKKRGLL